jgi:hypothetical protein
MVSERVPFPTLEGRYPGGVRFIRDCGKALGFGVALKNPAHRLSLGKRISRWTVMGLYVYP